MLTDHTDAIFAVREINRAAIKRGDSTPLQTIDDAQPSFWVGLWKGNNSLATLSDACAALHDRFDLQVTPAHQCISFRASTLRYFSHVLRITKKVVT